MTYQADVEWHGDEAEALIAKAVGEALLSVGQYVQGHAQAEVPVDTGDLKNSIFVKLLPDETNPTEVIVGTNKEHGPAIEFGSGLYGPDKAKYPIRPKNKKALFWKGAAHPVKLVMHPGVHPNPFMRRAFSKAKNHLQSIFSERMTAALSKLKGGGS